MFLTGYLGLIVFWLSARRILSWVWLFLLPYSKVYICLFISSLHPGSLRSTEVGVLRALSVMFSLRRSGWLFWMPAVFVALSIMQRLRARGPGILLWGLKDSQLSYSDSAFSSFLFFFTNRACCLLICFARVCLFTFTRADGIYDSCTFSSSLDLFHSIWRRFPNFTLSFALKQEG